MQKSAEAEDTTNPSVTHVDVGYIYEQSEAGSGEVVKEAYTS